MIEEKKRKEIELAKLPSDEAKRSFTNLSCKKEEPEVDDAKQLKFEPSSYNPISEIKGIDTKPVPLKVTPVLYSGFRAMWLQFQSHSVTEALS
ncbi:hypothetical protein MTR_4g113485 [Medicago truncatula]|uniref:Uncharacterized protein n=1 Tax=Medicago truncatula TaxID=3880 RepID=A0A072URW5_MEDTR|nr:hypothetical protein MTR_4g113485 [Medicago truncatula]